MDPVTWAAGAATLAAGVAGVVYIGRAILKVCRAVLDIADDWKGEPGRDGVPARPGVMRRLETLEHGMETVKKELRPNGGASMRDAINRVEENTARATPVQITVAPGALPAQQGGSQ